MKNLSKPIGVSQLLLLLFQIVPSESLVKVYKCFANGNNEEAKTGNFSSTINSAGKGETSIYIPQGFVASNEETEFRTECIQFDCKSTFQERLSSDVNDASRNWIYENGYIRIGTEYYAPDEYCVHNVSETTVDVSVCIPECGVKRACIPKCCPLNELFTVGANSGYRGCRTPLGENTSSVYFNPPLYENLNRKADVVSQPHYFLWHPKKFKYNCHMNKTHIVPFSHEVASNLSALFNSTFYALNFRIRADGAFLYKDMINKKCKVEEDPRPFLCFDGIQDYGSEAEFTNSEEEYVVHLCVGWQTEIVTQGSEGHIIYGILMLISAIFPLMTSLVYILLWRRQNVHGWTIASTTGSLFGMYLLQGAAHLIGLQDREDFTATFNCTLIAILGHFCFMAAFCWMTVMCCDLWWTFRALKPRSRHNDGCARFIKYSTFGWGLPAIIVIIGVVLDFLYSSEDDCVVPIVPGYGTHNCSVMPASQAYYIYYPVAVLLILNFVFFGTTCIKLLQYRKNTRFARKQETDQWQGFVRFTKLFIVMGISWATELCAFLIDGLSMKWYWLIFDILNILRAVGVFVVYVCKPDIGLMLEDMYPRLKNLLKPFKRRCSDELDQTGSTLVGMGMSIPAASASHQTPETIPMSEK